MVMWVRHALADLILTASLVDRESWADGCPGSMRVQSSACSRTEEKRRSWPHRAQRLPTSEINQ